MSREETAQYIRHQMKLTGGNLPVFTDGAVQMLYAASRGIARMVNLTRCTQIPQGTIRAS